MRILLPKNLKSVKDVDLMNFNIHQCNSVNATDIYVNFNNLEFLSPYGVISLLLSLESTMNNEPLNLNVAADKMNLKVLSYLERINFFQLLPIEIKNQFYEQTILGDLELRGRYDRSKHLLEITPIREENDVENICEKIYNICSILPNSKVCNDIAQISLELANNIIDHSDGYGYINIQYYSLNNTIRIAIADNGIGLVNRSRSLMPPNTSELEILENAFKNGSTTRTETQRGQGLGNVRNCSFNGYIENTKLTLKSGNNFFNLSQESISINPSEFYYPGTYYDFIISV